MFAALYAQHRLGIGISLEIFLLTRTPRIVCHATGGP